MKKIMFLFGSLFVGLVGAHAISYEDARQQALFLADKMAYELNLTEEQYEACYEINLDYLMGISSESDIYGDYWNQRNLDLSYILLDWQYQYFLDALYFYRPIYWLDGLWHFAVYSRYPYRDFFYFGRPKFVDTYRGGHAWRKNGGKSWYNDRKVEHKGAGVSNRGSSKDNSSGMRDRFNKGDYGRGQNIDTKGQSIRKDNKGQSSTRLTAGNAGSGGSSKSSPTSNRAGSTSSTKVSSGSPTASSSQRSGSTFNNTTTKQSASSSSTTRQSSPTTSKTSTTSASKTGSTSSSKSSTPVRSTTTSSKSTSSSTPRSTSSVNKGSSTTTKSSSSSLTKSSSSSVRSSSSSSTRSSSSVRSSSSGSSRSSSSAVRSSSSGARSSGGGARSGGGGRR